MTAPGKEPAAESPDMAPFEEKQPYAHFDASPTITREATGSDHGDPEKPHYLRIPTESHFRAESGSMSPSESREQATRLVDDLTLLQAERAVSQEEGAELRKSRSQTRTRESNQDVFNQPTPAVTIGIPTSSPNKFNHVFVLLKKLPRFVRYFLYALPITAILLIPILLGIFLPQGEQKAIGGEGGVQLLWFGVWLEVVWLSLWAARIVTSCLPYVMAGIAKILTSGNARKWRDMGRQLEFHSALFLWMLAVLVSFLPIVNNRKVPAADGSYPYVSWIDTVQKIIVAFFVLSVLNLAEKIAIQWIATTFHMRTYSTRIETNKQSIAYLVHLYEHSKDRLVSEEAVGYKSGAQTASGTRTPMAALQTNARQALNKVGDVANRMAGDFTGRQVRLSNHPRKVVTELLRNTSSAQVLGRRLFRTYAQSGAEVLTPADLRPAFPTEEDAENSFAIFDRDLNGDVSMEELEAFCDEVHREKKAIAASLKDLDSVIQKLDQVFMVIIVIIAALVFISIFSASTASALASASTFILGLSWLMQATAQEFLQSIIFVFVKHPFDVGDRVTVYGSNLGSMGRGDDYYVTEISLLYTEFKKMEGHIVQAPNSVLNTLFILNQRRSGQIADVFTLRMKYGTPATVISELEARMTEFVLDNKRDYGGKIITELTNIEDATAMSVNFICFHKTSFQNELLRLIRHNKFAIELMHQMVALNIEQPRPQYQISGREFPVFQANIQPPSYEEMQARPSVDESKLTATRRRADSRVSLTDTNDMFQDVYTVRKQQNVSFTHPPRIAEEPLAAASGSAIASGIDLDRVASAGSAAPSQSQNSNRLFARGGTLRRSQDNRSQDRADMV